MTTYVVKSTVISNRDATPKVLQDAYISGADIRETWGYVQTNGAADGAGSLYLLCTLPSNARVTSLLYSTNGLGSGCKLDIGVWYPTFIPVGAGLSASLANTAINSTIFASAYTASQAYDSQELVVAAAIPINSQEKQLWQVAGLTSDPMIDLDIVAFVHVAVASQGYVGLRARYTF